MLNAECKSLKFLILHSESLIHPGDLFRNPQALEATW